MLKNKKILILGGAGFIGCALCAHYCDDNVIVVADVADKSQCSLSSMGIQDHPNIRYLHMDVTDPRSMAGLDDDYDYIIHATAVLGIHKVVKESILTINTNFESCKNALELAKRQKSLKKFLTFSTSEVYGKYADCADESNVFQVGNGSEGRWCYAASKVLSEHLSFAYFRECGIPCIIIRPFNVFGEHRMGHNAMSKLIATALWNKPLILSGNGRQVRTWCYIVDFIQGVSKALESDLAGEVFNVGNPANELSILQLAELIRSLTASSSEIVISNSTEPDVLRRTLSIGKAEKLLGYKPEWNVQDGILKVVEWMKSLDKADLNSFLE